MLVFSPKAKYERRLQIDLDKDDSGGDPASHGETTTMSGACDTTADDGCDGSCPN
jgi:hypothetical protein